MMAQMDQAIVLAAGRGDRLRPWTDHHPKPLLTVAGRPLLFYHLDALRRAGVERIVLHVAYLAAQIREAVGNGAAWGLDVVYAQSPEPIETGGGICLSIPYLKNPDALFLTVNADIFCPDFEYQNNITPGCLHAVDSGQAGAHLVLVNTPQYKPGDFAFNAEGLIMASECGLTYSGIGLYHPDCFKTVDHLSSFSVLTVLFALMQEKRLTGEYYSGIWYDLGTLERWRQVEALYNGGSWGGHVGR
jgi:MurNAc alpha-1-phosphate uridylyltransferase